MSTGAFEDFTVAGGLESMFGGDENSMLNFNSQQVLLGLAIVYIIWFLWVNWNTLSGAGLRWNPLSSLMPAKAEGMSAGTRASYGMATMPGGTGKYMVTGDSLNNSSGWLGSDYLDVSNPGRRREGMWTGKEGMWTGKENMSNIDVYRGREGLFGHAEAPAFWEGNPYLTQAKQWGIPDLSGNFQDGSANTAYWGQENDRSQYEGLTQNQLQNVLNQ